MYAHPTILSSVAALWFTMSGHSADVRHVADPRCFMDALHVGNIWYLQARWLWQVCVCACCGLMLAKVPGWLPGAGDMVDIGVTLSQHWCVWCRACRVRGLATDMLSVFLDVCITRAVIRPVSCLPDWLVCWYGCMTAMAKIPLSLAAY